MFLVKYDLFLEIILIRTTLICTAQDVLSWYILLLLLSYDNNTVIIPYHNNTRIIFPLCSQEHWLKCCQILLHVVWCMLHIALYHEKCNNIICRIPLIRGWINRLGVEYIRFLFNYQWYAIGSNVDMTAFSEMPFI